MKKLLIIVLIALPLTASAVWYNPLTWFKSESSPGISVGGPSAGTVSYTSTLLPLNDSLWDVGTSTRAYRQGWFDELCLTGDTCETSWPVGSGGSGGGTWSTTTSSVAGQLFNYPNNATDIVTIGSNSSTTAEFYYDPNVFNLFVKSASSTIAGGLNVVGNLSALTNFVFDSQTFDSLTDDITLDNNAGDLQVVDVTCTNCLTTTEVASADLATLSTNVSDADFGDVTVSSGAWAVEDDSHAHTGTTLSGIDISSDTNLTAGTNITLTGDDLSVDDAFILNTGDIGTGAYTFPFASTTFLTVSNGLIAQASSTFTSLLNFPYSSSTVYSSFIVASSTSYQGAGLTGLSCIGTTNKITFASGYFRCETDETGGAGSVDGTGVANTIAMWTDSNTLQATSSHPLYVGSIIATSTSLISDLPRLTSQYSSSTIYSSFQTSSTTDATMSSLDILNIFKLPVSASPSMGVVGRFALDTTSNNLILATTTSGHIVVASATSSQSFIASTTSLVAGTVLPLPAKALQRVFVGVICDVSSGTSLVFNLSNSTGTSDTNSITCTTTSTQYAFTTNNVFAAYDKGRIEISAKTGDTGYWSATLLYYEISN